MLGEFLLIGVSVEKCHSPGCQTTPTLHNVTVSPCHSVTVSQCHNVTTPTLHNVTMSLLPHCTMSQCHSVTMSQPGMPNYSHTAQWGTMACLGSTPIRRPLLIFGRDVENATLDHFYFFIRTYHRHPETIATLPT